MTEKILESISYIHTGNSHRTKGNNGRGHHLFLFLKILKMYIYQNEEKQQKMMIWRRNLRTKTYYYYFIKKFNKNILEQVNNMYV